MKLSDMSLVSGAVAPVAVAVGAVVFRLSDAGIAAISFMFAVALVPGVLQCYATKTGWSKQSTTMTASGLLSMGAIFLSLGLVLSFLSSLVTGVLWLVLAAQAFKYAEPKDDATQRRRELLDKYPAIVQTLNMGTVLGEPPYGGFADDPDFPRDPRPGGKAR